MHKIYNDTVWQDGQTVDGFKGMGFVIKKIVVHSEPTRVRPGESHYNMIREKWDVRNLLEVSLEFVVCTNIKNARFVFLSTFWFCLQGILAPDGTQGILLVALVHSPDIQK